MRERVRVEYGCVCLGKSVCVRGRERGRERARDRGRDRGIERGRERGREREREGESRSGGDDCCVMCRYSERT